MATLDEHWLSEDGHPMAHDVFAMTCGLHLFHLRRDDSFEQSDQSVEIDWFCDVFVEPGDECCRSI